MERAPVTGRWRFVCVSEEYEAELGRTSYEHAMEDYRDQILRPDDPRHKMVGRVLERLLPNSGLKGDVEFHVIKDDEEVNAFVIPGNKIFVFSGIMPICNNEDGLASILGHEIAHNVAHHVQENASLPYLTTLILGLASFFVDNSAQLTQFVLSYGLELPNSRAQETEADYLGLLMMAQSCYNPEEALKVWDRMAKADQSATPQFLSTHPTDRNRLKRFQQWLPEAIEKQAQSQCGHMTQHSNEFQQAFVSYTGQGQDHPVLGTDNDNDFW
ncbi:metalloendopeptidase [Xanthoria calcicola]